MRISIGLGGLIFFVLFAMKIAGAIEMGWFWVLTSIIWAPAMINFVVIIILVVLLVSLGKRY